MELTTAEIKLIIHAILTTIITEERTKYDLEGAPFGVIDEHEILILNERNRSLHKLLSRFELFLKYLEAKSGRLR